MAFDSSGCGGSASIVHVFPDDYQKTGPTDDTKKKKREKKEIHSIYILVRSMSDETQCHTFVIRFQGGGPQNRFCSFLLFLTGIGHHRLTIGNGCGETILAFFQTPQKKSAARGGIKRAQSTKNEAETGERKG